MIASSIELKRFPERVFGAVSVVAEKLIAIVVFYGVAAASDDARRRTWGQRLWPRVASSLKLLCNDGG